MKADIPAPLRAENAELRARLAEAEETLRAIRNGEVDALVVGERLYMLAVADAASTKLRGLALEKDELLTQITDLTPTLLTRCGRDLRYLFANRATADFFGIAPEEITGKTIREILGEDAFTRILPYIERVLQGERVEFETEITYPAAGRRFMSIAYVPEYDNQNNVVGWFATITDITERKRAEEASMRLAAIVSTSADAILSKTLDGVITSWNESAQRMFGYTAEEILNQSILRLIPPELRFEEEQILARVKAGEVIDHYETVRVTKDGRRMDVSLTISPMKDSAGKIIGASKIVRDITERKQAEEKLRESEERLRLAQSAANIGTFDWDIAGGLSVWAPETEMMWGLPGGGFGGTYDDWKRQVHPEDLLGASDMVRLALADPDTPYSFEYRIIRPDGAVRWIYAKGSTIRDESGRPVRMIGINMDVTDRKQAEAERERLLAEEQRLREAAEAAARAKDEFLAVVSHELRSPLNAILGYARMTSAKSKDAAAVARYGEIIVRHARMQQQLIEDLLDTARVITGKLKLELATADLRLVLEEAVEVVRPAAEAKRIELSTLIGRAPKQLFCDAARLRQVVWNLLQNAIKFTPEGGRVELRMKRAGQRVHLIISDTGRGIEPDFLPAVFDRFSQGDMSLTRRHGGLGLGLALAKELVEMHGGTIEAASAGAGKGSIFTVTLPLGAPQAASYPLPARHVTEINTGPGAMPLKDLPRLDGLRVLVVDDQEEARLMIAQSLGEWGADVMVAASGREALELIEGAAFDAVVCDIAMPEMDGYEFIARLRALGGAPELSHLSRLPAVALTALARAEDRMQSLAAGFQMHVAKPVEPAELIMVIASMILNQRKSAMRN
ncbi:MAG TPA: PAS domain S-box protein [Blastocatellia bacterium]|nr:PAS domain S-box protein [Blastocatellia bacterium]